MTSLTRRVYDLLSAGASVQAITGQLKLPPSRLKRIINSRAKSLIKTATTFLKLTEKYKTVQSGTEWYRRAKS
jgi:hypothetical protein